MMTSSIEVLRDVEALYFAYADAIDHDIDTWPDLFTDDAIYKAIPRENYDRGFPLAAIGCEGRGMILDRAMAVRSTTVYAERYMRHAITNIRVIDGDAHLLEARANFAIYETLERSTTRLFAVGRYIDTIERRDDGLKFKQKLCVIDGNIVIGSLIYPV